VRLRLSVRRLVVASWPVEQEAVRHAAPGGLEPARVDGECLASVVAVRFRGGRLGRLPVPPFSQLNLRTYVEAEPGGEPAVLFLRSYVTPGGLPGILVGAPFRPARVRVREDCVRAPAAGVALAFRTGAQTDPGELGRHELGIYEAAGLKRVRVERGPAEWRRADPVGECRADGLLALGLDVHGPPRIAVAGETWFETDVPPGVS
jgi:hypothetical protein